MPGDYSMYPQFERAASILNGPVYDRSNLELALSHIRSIPATLRLIEIMSRFGVVGARIRIPRGQTAHRQMGVWAVWSEPAVIDEDVRSLDVQRTACKSGLVPFALDSTGGGYDLYAQVNGDKCEVVQVWPDWVRPDQELDPRAVALVMADIDDLAKFMKPSR